MLEVGMKLEHKVGIWNDKLEVRTKSWKLEQKIGSWKLEQSWTLKHCWNLEQN